MGGGPKDAERGLAVEKSEGGIMVSNSVFLGFFLGTSGGVGLEIFKKDFK